MNEYKKTVHTMDEQTILKEKESLSKRIDQINNEIAQMPEGHSRTKLYREQQEIKERYHIIMNYGK